MFQVMKLHLRTNHVDLLAIEVLPFQVYSRSFWVSAAT